MVVMLASFVVWDVCEGSDITDGGFAKMRGGNTRTAGYRVFLFYCEERHIHLCLVCSRNDDSILTIGR